MIFFSLTVPENFSCSNPMRLDVFIAEKIPEMNRSKLKTGLHEIFVNEKKEKLSYKIKANDKIEFAWEENVPDDIAPEEIPLRILFENDDVMVLNKAQGMVVHPALGHWNGTLVNALLYHWKMNAISICEKNFESEKNRRPGIVHRLDKETSGVMIVAKNRVAEEFLSSQFKNRKVRKEYFAIVQGRPPALAGDIKTQIVRDKKHRMRFTVSQNEDEGKFARTIYHCVASYGNYSLMHIRLKTGRTHQIRVHLKYIGCPILGDELYGKKDALFPNVRLLLHSRLLIIHLPKKENAMRFRATIPKRFFDTMKILKEKFPKEKMEFGKRHAKHKNR